MDIELLRRLTAAPGTTGFEGQVRAAVEREIAPLVDEIRVDRLGNLIATRRGGSPVVMLAAHMDEIGFLVRHVDDRGFVRLQPLGSFDPRVLLAQRAVVLRGMATASSASSRRHPNHYTSAPRSTPGGRR